MCFFFWKSWMLSMGDGGVACVAASQNFMEHFNSSEPFCGNHGFEKSQNSGQLLDDDQQVAGNLQRNKKEGSSSGEFHCENANNNDVVGSSRAKIHVVEFGKSNSSDVIVGSTVNTASTSYSEEVVAVEHLDRPKRSSRWDVTQESNGWDSRIRENGVGVGLRRHDERHKEVELGLGQDNVGRELNHHGEKLCGLDVRLKSRRGVVSDDLHSRSGHFESSSCKNSSERYSVDRYPGHCKSNSSSRSHYDRHSRHFEFSASRIVHERYSSRRSGSADKGGYCERSSYESRRCQYEERNGYKKSSADKYYNRYNSSQVYDDRKYHRREVEWRESRRHSNYRQSHSGWDRGDDGRLSDVRQSHSGWGERNLDENRQSDGRQSHSSWSDRVLDDNRHSDSRQSHSGWDQVLDDGKGWNSTSWGNHGRSAYSSLVKDSRSSKDVEAQLSASPAQTPASDRSVRLHDEVRSEGNNTHLSEQSALSEPPKHEESICRGWVYIDHLGIEQGPLKLADLRMLVDDGQLQSDHLIKREGSDEWVTLENAASPMPLGKLSLITSKCSPQTQSDPVTEIPSNKTGVEANNSKNVQGMPNCDSIHSAPQDSNTNVWFEDFHIDERIEKLMQGFPLIPGRENEIVSEALRHAARHVNHSLEHNAECEGSPGLKDGYDKYCNRWRDAELGRGSENDSNVSKIATTLGATLKKDLDYDKDVSTGTGIRGEGYSHFSGRWPSKGGDWKRTGENVGGCDRLLRKKVLNDGVPLCHILKSERVMDPRRFLKEASSYATQGKRLEVPRWAYQWQEEKIDPFQKTDVALEIHLQSGQGSIATPKAHAATSKYQVCTPGSQISTPRGTVTSHCGHDVLKTVRTNNGDLSKILIGNKLNQHVSSATKVPNIGKATSSFQCEMKSVLKRNTAIFKESGPSAWELSANNQYMEQNFVKAERIPHQQLHCSMPAEDARVSPSRVHVSGLRQAPEAEVTQASEVISSAYVKTVNDLKLDEGEWFYRDGAGHEKGPLTYAQLQMHVSDGILQKNSSAYRKSDDTWVPISHEFSANLNSLEKAIVVDSPCHPPGTASPACKDPEQHELQDCTPNNFHALYPQFVGYARGKLHEHVMKSYRSRDFAAAIGEVLDAWLNPKQSKNSKDERTSSISISRHSSVIDSLGNKDNGFNLHNSEGKLDRNKSTSTSQHNNSHNFSRSGLYLLESEKVSSHSRFEIELADSHSHGKNQDTCKRRRLQVIQESDKRNVARSELQEDFDVDKSCGDLDQEATSHFEDISNTQTNVHGSMMDRRILERVFHFLGDDLKSISSSAATCKRWNTVIRTMKSKTRRIDFSYLGAICSDVVFQSIMGSYREGKIKHLILKSCTNLSADALANFLNGCSSIVSIDITGCNQFRDVARMFSNVKWQRSHVPGPSSSGDQSEETHCKVKSLKQINDKFYGSCRSSRALDIHTSDDSAGRDMVIPPLEADQEEPMDVDDLHVDSKITVSPVRQRTHLAKRFKLNSNGKSAKIQMEDGSFKGESLGRSSTGYSVGGDKMIERHLSATLKDILGVNTNNYFLQRALKIEQRIKSGGYSGHMQGIFSFENDVFLLCRKAFQEHKKGSQEHVAAEEIFKAAHRHIKNLKHKFIKVFSGGTQHHKSTNGNEMMPRLGKDKSQSNLYTSSNVKKRYGRGMAMAAKRSKRRRGMSNSDCSDFIEEDMSDRERRISKQKKRHWSDSETETSESSGFLEEEFLEKDDKNDIDDSDLDMKYDSEGEYGGFYEQKYALEDELEISVREWGAKMTTDSLVPPVTRKYEVIDEYVIVTDEAEVHRKMKVCLPDDYEKKLKAAQDNRDNNYAHLDIPELKEFRPRKQLGVEVLEQEVYGIDPYTHNLIFDTMPKGEFTFDERHTIIEEVLLRVLNESVRDYTGTGKTPMEYPVQDVVQRMIVQAEKCDDVHKQTFFQGLLKTMQSRESTEKYVAYRKGLGVVCNKEGGFEKDDFVVEFLGEVYPAWRWYEKQDGIRSFQKKDKDPAPEFYNIVLERPKSDGAGYDLVVVDAMHKANYASRICHSCRPNCEAKVTAVDGQYQIGLYTLRPIQYGEEITFDYNSLTESKEEYEASVCLCGTYGCRGSYLNLAGAGAYQKVLKECHSILNRHHLLLEACTNSVSQEDLNDLRNAGVGTCLLSGLPGWAIAYSARVVRFMNLERSRLPDQIVKHIRKEKRKAGFEISYECDERGEAEVQAEGFYNQRLHNLAITLDKARYIIRNIHQDPKKAPPPLRKLDSTELVSLLWKGENSLVEELLRCMANHVDVERLNRLKQQVHMRELSGSKNIEKSLRESLLWLRDELRNMPSSCRCRHDAAADLIHLYAYTKCFFKSLDYGPLVSPPLYISPLDLGPKYADSLGAGFQEWQKTYSKDYALGQLIYWFKQTSSDPGASLNKARRGCLVLPEISSCYAKTHKQELSQDYGSKQRAELIRRMEREPQKPWPRGEFWEFKINRGLFGSPMFDAVMNNSSLDKEMVQWLKNRSSPFEGSYYH
ncbi:histone-lysine N-methyltransferase ATXR3 [Cryptomeria japonica]|uniref:histone-lysine N-methyltransferase ATXR3 n=1 Tax=Cryptomeria japonica TaxID=3369 RepID=UPI0027DA5EB8|nr:histone-lysine N-methyltransferase ATXR3 [Cryptomeria japonica]